MFDWDADYDDLVHGNRTSTAITASRPTDVTSSMGRFALGGAILCAALVALFPNASGTASGSAVAFAAMSPVMAAGVVHQLPMPDGLRTYSEAEFRSFSAGVAGATDADLIAYIRRTEGDLLHAAQGWGADALHDALILLQLELDMRGLSETQTMLRPDLSVRG